VEGERKQNASHALIDLTFSESLLRVTVERDSLLIVIPFIIHVGWKRLRCGDYLDLHLQRLGDFGGCGSYGVQSVSVGWGVD